ncbi:MAG: extracellular solute-binding protein [Alphaproteobacteria bacterium]|nr:MAG: extracellular solute-binding protein [Alphaproteobacteria bacterium]
MTVRILAAGAALAALAGAATAEELHIYNWTDYTAPELIEKFEAETGIDVIVDTYDTNETLLAKLKSGATGYDIVVPSQHFVKIMIQEGLLQKIDIKSMPNYANVDPRWKNPPWDPNQEYSVPWQWGSASFSYRADLYSGKGESLKEFFEPSEEVSGRLQVFASPDEVYNMANLYLGLPFCSEDPEDAKKVLALFQAQKPHVLTYSSEGMNDRLATGEVIMATHWNGYSLVGRREANPNIIYAYPKEGIVGWFDSLVVPVGASNVEAARKFMNFVMDPENIALQSNFAAYSNGIMGSEKYMDEALRTAPELNPPADVPVKFGEACSAEAQKLIERVWTQLLQ